MLRPEKIRKDFPVLQRKIRGKPIIYLDSACMSLKPIQVINAMNNYYAKFPACSGSRSNHELSQEVSERIKKSRKLIKKFFNAPNKGEMVFTRNTTEAINLVAKSLNYKKKKVLTTDREHNSNLVPWQVLAEEGKIKHEVVKSKTDHSFNMQRFEKMLGSETKLVSVVHSSNLDGYTTPVKEIIKIAHEKGALVLVDAAQSAPHKEINLKKLDPDFMVCSGHKMLGPTGTGILYGKKEALEQLKPFITGGDTVIETTYETHEWEPVPQRFEAGLQDYAGIIGFGEAVRYLSKIGLSKISRHEEKLKRILLEETESIHELETIGNKNYSGIFNFNIKSINFHEVAGILNAQNIMIRSGVHCLHSWYNAHRIEGSARASLYLYNTEEECIRLAENLKEIAKLA